MVECRPALDIVSRFGVQRLASASTGSSSNPIEGACTASRHAPASGAITLQHMDKNLFHRTGAYCGEVGLAGSAELDDAAEVVVKTTPAFTKNAEAARRGNARLRCSPPAGVFGRDDFSWALKTRRALAKCLAWMAILPRSIETVMSRNNPENR
jgi:hypothetical protein